jgi:hypothetical protein
LNLEILATPAFVFLVVASLGILISQDWRWVIAFFAVQYLGVLILVGLSWPFGLAGIKLVVGWMAGAALGATQIGQKRALLGKSWPASRVFRLLAAGLAILLIYSISPQVVTWVPGLNLSVARGGLTLISLGLLHLGMTARSFRVIIGLLTVLAGFEILYASVEASVLVAGLLAAINLGLAFLGSYFLSNATPEELV